MSLSSDCKEKLLSTFLGVSSAAAGILGAGTPAALLGASTTLPALAGSLSKEQGASFDRALRQFKEIIDEAERQWISSNPGRNYKQFDHVAAMHEVESVIIKINISPHDFVEARFDGQKFALLFVARVALLNPIFSEGSENPAARRLLLRIVEHAFDFYRAQPIFANVIAAPSFKELLEGQSHIRGEVENIRERVDELVDHLQSDDKGRLALRAEIDRLREENVLSERMIRDFLIDTSSR